MGPCQRYHYRLMSNSMPGFVDPHRMAKNKQSLQGTIPVASMTRAVKLLASDEGELTYSLLFDADEDGCCFISGELQGKFSMRCQRCMQTMVKELKCSFKVSPVLNDEQAKALASDYEPVIVADDKLEPASLIEDELILAVPIVVMHEVNESGCVDSYAAKAQEPANPFRILQELKLKNKGQQAGDKNGSTTES